MIEELTKSGCVIVLAAESANWKIGGLRQLDRLALAVNELVDAKITLVVFWQPDIQPAQRWLPSTDRLSNARITNDLAEIKVGARAISTSLLVDRQGLAEYLATNPAVRVRQLAGLSWGELSNELEQHSALHSASDQGWRYLQSRADIRDAVKLILRRSGKTQDGIVSRLINRPLSRPITYLLLKLPVTPTTWTLAIFLLPLLAVAFLWRGNYPDIVAGAILYQVYSMLDGCDGEIARAKYLESERGGRIDSYCDMIGGFLFLLGLGAGLSRASVPQTNLYFVEAILSVVLVSLHEWLLRQTKRGAPKSFRELSGALYSRHQQMIQGSGILFLGEKFVWWILQLSKRDVIIMAFLVLVTLGLSTWILHYSVIAGAIGLWLSGRSYFTTRRDRVT